MIDTNRIRSGYDLEFQLGAGWFFTALNGLAERGLLIPPGSIPFLSEDAVIEVTSVAIIFDTPNRDLQIDLLIGGILPVPVLASISLSDTGDELIIENNLVDEPVVVPFGVISGLATVPAFVKLPGDGNHEPVFALLANIDLRVSPQGGPPLPRDEHVPRGDQANAISFLPNDQDMAIGLPNEILSRFANDIWHSQLSDENGNHPFPNMDERQGDWQSVSMSAESDRIRVVLRARAEIDTPIIDIVPDPDISITVDLIPIITDGSLSFELVVDANIDFGLLGNLLAGFIGGLIGFIIGLFTGNPFSGAAIGAALGVITLEVGEAIIGNRIAREIQAEIDGTPLTKTFKCENNVIHLATFPDEGQGLNLGLLDALPTSVPIFTDNPDRLYRRTVLVISNFSSITINDNGFGLVAQSELVERYLPEDANISSQSSIDGGLTSLTYRLSNNDDFELPISEVLQRASADEIPEPLNVLDSGTEDLILRKEEGQLPVVCLHPVAIRREDTIIREIRFTSGLEMKTEDTIMLQDAGALLLPNLQLIHPDNGEPYYRSAPNDSEEDNFENMPEF